RLASMHRDLVKLASLDSLTGIFNRRAFFERAEEIRAQLPSIATFSAIMLDIDHFKNINDVYGHGMGDRAIREVAGIIANAGPIVGRLGGEEFAVLLPGRKLTTAHEVAERLRREMASLRFDTNGETVTLTCSFGVSEWRDGESVDDILRRADMALYAAKAAGRDRVVSADAALNAADYDSAGRPVRAAHRLDVPLAPETGAAEDQRELPTSASR
ncbi:MAG: GGDEF domain-containing protein, partial [Xanthobacteraceae bacterium]